MAFNYPYGDTQQLNLNWFLSQWETFRAQWAAAEEGIDHALDAEIARVEEAMTDLYAARDAAAASKTAAQTAATNAASSATVATQQATLAQSYANTAQTQAGIATAAAEAAGNSASSASTSATAANLSKTQAANSATAAQTAQTAAEAAETNIVSIITDAIQDAADAAAATATADAEAAADAAEASATAAAGSASDASDSATAAAGSASDAADSATAAAGSATAAAGSATAAAGSASDAADSATAAAASAASIVVDSAMSDSSTNPVQNKVINGEITELKTALTLKTQSIIDSFSDEATKSGTYFQVNAIESVGEIASETQNLSVEHLGKNLLKTPYLWPDGYEANGVTFMPLPDGRIHVYGTATADAICRITPETPSGSRNPLKAGTYTLSGTPSDGGQGIGRIFLSGVGQGTLYDNGNGVTFTISADGSYYVKIGVTSGVTIDTYFSPMIEIGSAKTAYEPYVTETITLSNGKAKVDLYNGVNTFIASNSLSLVYTVPNTINLKSYGAVGNGITDDTAAIQQALTDAAGKTLIIPEGTYLFSKTLFIKSGTKIIGSGVNSKFKLASAFTLSPYPWRTDEAPDSVRYPMIRTEDNSSGCILSNFALQGQTTQFHDVACDGLYITGENHIIENLVVSDINYFPSDFSSRTANGVGYGIRLGNVDEISVRNCTVYNSGYEGLGTEDATNVLIENCKFGDANQTGLQIHRSSSHVKVNGCTVQFTSGMTQPALTFHAIEAYPMDDIHVDNCYFCRAATFIGGYENGISFTNNVVAAGFMSVNGETYRQNWKVRGNEFRAGGIRTIRVDNCIITDNIINCSTGSYMIILKGNKTVVDNNLAIGSVTPVLVETHE